VGEYLKMQKRYRHLHEAQIGLIQSQVDEDWLNLLEKTKSRS
jgi:hypothetical protein